MSIACPICRDPTAYPLWVDKEPPRGCPHDESWHGGGPVTIKNISECSWQLKKAWQSAEFRKLVPDAFDNTGTMKDGRLADVLTAFAMAHPDKAFVV